MVEKMDRVNFIGEMVIIIKEIGKKEICMEKEHYLKKEEYKQENGLKENIKKINDHNKYLNNKSKNNFKILNQWEIYELDLPNLLISSAASYYKCFIAIYMAVYPSF